MAGQRGEVESGDGESLAGLLPRSWPILSEEFNTPIHRFGPASHQIMPLAFIDMERYIFIQSLGFVSKLFHVSFFQFFRVT